jgi:hypothetical protein
MVQVRLDRIEGCVYRLSADRIEAARVATVSGLGGHAADRLRAALEVTGVPRIGESHPTIPNLYAQDLQVEPDGPTAAVITVRYRSRAAHSGQPPLLEVGSSVVQTTTDTDATGTRITVSYSPSGLAADTKTQGANLSILAPQTTLRFTRTEDASPLAKARTFVGTVNRTAVFDSAAGTWLCTAITGRSADGGGSYELTYEFQYESAGWQPKAIYIDPRTNRPPSDLVTDVGVKTVSIYPEREFKDLGL